MLSNFELCKLPRIIFGAGKINELPALAKLYGHRTLLITGQSSLEQSGTLLHIRKNLFEHGIESEHIKIAGEPSPDFIDNTVASYKPNPPDVVIAVGGGSVLDAGKAVSAMLTQNVSVIDFLEGVGTGAIHNGHKLPFIAVPTTAGTGSEATKNAVLSKPGKNGFKKSLRHNNFVPDIALVDPELTMRCPQHITAACAMDALTQLIESYISTAANPASDALALDALKRFASSFPAVCNPGNNNIEHRTNLSYAALVSGITLANTDLGTVHGFASSIGGQYNIPHGVICANLLPPVLRVSIDLLKKTSPKLLDKFKTISLILTNTPENDPKCLEKLLEKLELWLEQLPIPPLLQYSIPEEDIYAICAQTSNKNNPAHLCINDLIKVLAKT